VPAQQYTAGDSQPFARWRSRAVLSGSFHLLLTFDGDDALAQEAYANAERILAVLPSEEMQQKFVAIAAL
jgi:hypothetical protein